jgi:hypothetical protein
MTIPEAAQLVLQAGAADETGKIYVLDMGTPVKMVDLARNLIRLAGYKPDEDIKIVYIGLRPGEKLYEELMRPEEQAGMTRTAHEKIFVAPPTVLDEAVFDEKIRALLESFKDKLHPDVYGAWKMYVDDLAKSPLQQYNESLAGKDEDMAQKELDAQAKGYESWADYDSAVLMGREPVYDDFYITGTPIADADIPELVTKKIKHDGFSGPYDPNHTTTWVEVGANKYVVWYEGEWYWATGPNSTQKADTMVGTIQDQYGIR